MDPASLCKSCHQKIPKVPESADLDLTATVPAEIWATVFDHLGVFDLLNVRRTCRSWKQIVDGSRTLRDRFRVDFAGIKPMDEGYRPVILPAAHAEMGCCEIVGMAAVWWLEFAEGLVSLELNCSGVSLGTLLGMLRQTGSLKELALIQVYYLPGDEVRGVDFRMDHLERLELRNDKSAGERQTNVPSNLLDLLGVICVRLRYLAVGGTWDEEKVLRLIEVNESKLEGIQIDATNELLSSLSMLMQLKLKQVGLLRVTQYNSDVFGFFFQLQRHVTDLTVSAGAIPFLSEPEFHQLKLTHLRVDLKGGKITLCTLQMPTLKYLKVSGYNDSQVYFKGCQLTTIEELCLTHIRPRDNSLTDYLLSCPNLRILKLVGVTIDPGMSLAYVLDQKLNSLRTLIVYLVSMPRRVLLHLFQLTPNLEHLELKSVFCVNDDVILKLARCLQNLRRLSISCNIGEASVDHIINHHGEHLRQLDYCEYWNVPERARKKLLDHFTPLQCRVDFPGHCVSIGRRNLI